MHGKAIWKPVIAEIVKASRDFAPEPHNGGLIAPPWTPNWKGQRADARWVMAYVHKTQSFMKNGGQQKCLDKALPLPGQSNFLEVLNYNINKIDSLNNEIYIIGDFNINLYT